MFTQVLQRGEYYWGTDKENRLVLQGRHYDLMRRPDTVDIGWAIGDGEIAGVYHPQINMQSFPELDGAPGSCLGAAFAAFVGPFCPNALAALHVFSAVFVQPAHLRLEPRVEYGHTHGLEELAYAIAPAELFFGRARSDKIHGTGEIYSRAFQQPIFTFTAWH